MCTAPGAQQLAAVGSSWQHVTRSVACIDKQPIAAPAVTHLVSTSLCCASCLPHHGAQLFSCSHPASRVAAKVVYNEFIADRHHIHMNSTRWLTLTEFVKYLGREGKCKVEETEKGWFITLIRVRRQHSASCLAQYMSASLSCSPSGRYWTAAARNLQGTATLRQQLASICKLWSLQALTLHILCVPPAAPVPDLCVPAGGPC